MPSSLTNNRQKLSKGSIDQHLVIAYHDSKLQWSFQVSKELTLTVIFSDSKEINADDLEFKNITSSLTRKQADAVKRRINKLNAKVKERLSLQETSSGPQRLFLPENNNSRQKSQHADVRSLFPTQTVGEASNKAAPSFKSRHSYSEGVPVTRSEVMSIFACSQNSC